MITQEQAERDFAALLSIGMPIDQALEVLEAWITPATCRVQRAQQSLARRIADSHHTRVPPDWVLRQRSLSMFAALNDPDVEREYEPDPPDLARADDDLGR